MNKVIKVISIVLTVLILTTTISNVCFAAETIISGMGGDKFEPTNNTDVNKVAKKILGIIQMLAVVAGVIIIAALGIKYMLGSTEEKAVTKKAFIPLIIGIVLVVFAGQIAKLLFDIGK